MNVGDLRRALANVPDDFEVVVPGSDHTYLQVHRAQVEFAYFDGPAGDITEAYRGAPSSSEYGDLGRVFVVGGH